MITNKDIKEVDRIIFKFDNNGKQWLGLIINSGQIKEFVEALQRFHDEKPDNDIVFQTKGDFQKPEYITTKSAAALFAVGCMKWLEYLFSILNS